ncbi:MAG: hypothetical protein V4662_04735 [Verrucomicrobiota bacterium]
MRQIPESEFSGPALKEAACLFRLPKTLHVGFPIEWETYWDDGLGPAKIAVFELKNGVFFSLQHHELSPRKDLMVVYVSRGDIALHVDHVLTALGLTSNDLGWLAVGVHLKPARLTRQDYNGVQFHVGDFPCRADAEATVVRLAAGAHKQAYFIEPIMGRGPSLRFPDDYSGPPTIVPA